MHIYHLIPISTSNDKFIVWVRGSIELVLHTFDRCLEVSRGVGILADDIHLEALKLVERACI